MEYKEQNTECVVGLNIFFIDSKYRDHRIISGEPFFTPDMFVHSVTFQHALDFEVRYFKALPFVEFSDTLFQENS